MCVWGGEGGDEHLAWQTFGFSIETYPEAIFTHFLQQKMPHFVMEYIRDET